MEMVKCPACQHDVSDEAMSCPGCGQPLKAPPTPPPMPRQGKKQSNWWIGCIVAGAIGFLAIPVIGLLAAIAIPSFVKAREVARENMCANNVRMIEHAKAEVALKRNSTAGDALPAEDVKQVLAESQAEGRAPFCPGDPQESFETSYEIGAVGEEVTCLHHGPDETVAQSHRLAPVRDRSP